MLHLRQAIVPPSSYWRAMTQQGLQTEVPANPAALHLWSYPGIQSTCAVDDVRSSVRSRKKEVQGLVWSHYQNGFKKNNTLLIIAFIWNSVWWRTASLAFKSTEACSLCTSAKSFRPHLPSLASKLQHIPRLPLWNEGYDFPHHRGRTTTSWSQYKMAKF